MNAELAASAFGVSPESIIVGNGAAELIKSMMGFIKGKTGFVRPTFDEYPNRYTEIETVNYLVESEDFSYSASDLIEYFDKTTISNLVLVNPDNRMLHGVLDESCITIIASVDFFLIVSSHMEAIFIKDRKS